MFSFSSKNCFWALVIVQVLVLVAIPVLPIVLLLVTRPLKGPKEAGPAYFVAFSPNGRQILDSKVRLWNVETGEELSSFGDSRPAVCALFSPDGQEAAFAHADEVVHLWDLRNGREIRTFVGHSRSITCLAFTPDGRQLVSGSRDRTLRLWDVNSGKELRRFLGHEADVNSIAVSSDGNLILSGGGDYRGGKSNDPCIRLWDLKKGEELPRFNGEFGVTNCVAFSPDNSLAISCGWDTGIQIWDVQSGKELRRFGQRGINQVAFSPDGKQVLSGGRKGEVQLWDVASGKQIREFRGHVSEVHGVAVASDGLYAVSCAGHSGGKKTLLGIRAIPVDCTIRIWDFKTGKELRRLGKSGDQD